MWRGSSEDNVFITEEASTQASCRARFPQEHKLGSDQVGVLELHPSTASGSAAVLDQVCAQLPPAGEEGGAVGALEGWPGGVLAEHVLQQQPRGAECVGAVAALVHDHHWVAPQVALQQGPGLKHLPAQVAGKGEALVCDFSGRVPAAAGRPDIGHHGRWRARW